MVELSGGLAEEIGVWISKGIPAKWLNSKRNHARIAIGTPEEIPVSGFAFSNDPGEILEEDREGILLQIAKVISGKMSVEMLAVSLKISERKLKKFQERLLVFLKKNLWRVL